MTSLTERLTGKGTRQVMEYEEESVHNMPMAARNAVVSMAKKVEENILCVMTAPVVMPPSAMPKTPDNVGWISHCEKTQTMKKYKMVLTQVLANRTSSKALSYWPSLGLM